MELGRLYRLSGDPESARTYLAHSLRLKEAQWSVGHQQVTTVQIQLAQVELALGNDEQAENLCLEAIPYLKEPQHQSFYATAAMIRARVAKNAGDDEASDEIIKSAREHLVSLGLKEHRIDELLLEQ